MTEMFDITMALNLAKHEGVDQETRKNLKRYRKQATNGHQFRTVYCFGDKWEDLRIGRLTPKPYIGLTAFPRNVRAALASKYYWDIDMVNAQPVLLLHIAKQYNLPMPGLTHYVANRESILEELTSQGITRDEAKDLCIATLFGGHRFQHPILPLMTKDLTRLANEIVSDETYSNVYERAQSLSVKEKKNPIFTTLSVVVQDLERRVFFCAKKHLESVNRNVDTYEYDGGMLRRLQGETQMPDHLIPALQEAVATEMGVEILFAFKSLSHTFVFHEGDYDMETRKVYLEMKASFDSKNVRLEDPVCFYCRIDEADDTPGYWKFYKSADFNIKNEQLVLPNKKPFVTVWRADPDAPSYARVGFYPKRELCPNRVLNDFKGFAAEKVDEAVEEPLVLELLRLICESDEAFEYTLNFFAWLVQFPHLRMGVFLLFQGGQGTGKDTWVRWFGEAILGKDVYLNTSGAKLFDRFNNYLRHRLLIHIEEADSVFQVNSEKFKTFLTNTEIEIESKGIDVVKCDRYDSVVLTTQSYQSCVVEADDRRAFIQSVREHPYKGNREWFGKWRDACYKPSAIRWFFNYLMERDLSAFDPIKSRPETRGLVIAKSLSVPSHYCFLENLAFKWPVEFYEPNDERADEVVRIGSKELWDKFVKWSQETGATMGQIRSNMKLVMALEEGCVQGVSRRRGRKGVSFYIEINTLRKWLVDKRFIHEPLHRNVVYPSQCATTATGPSLEILDGEEEGGEGVGV